MARKPKIYLFFGERKAEALLKMKERPDLTLEKFILLFKAGYIEKDAKKIEKYRSSPLSELSITPRSEPGNPVYLKEDKLSLLRKYSLTIMMASFLH